VNAAGRVAVVAIAGYAYGAVTAAIPAPGDPAVFWPGNLAAPYVALPFLAATWRFDRRVAALAGMLTAMAMVAGFYGFLFVGGVTPSELDLPLTTTVREAMLTAYGRWLGTFVLGSPGGIPWLVVAAVVGLIAGLLGHAWAAGGRTWAGVAVASLFVLEPLIRLLGAAGVLPVPGANELLPANVAVWAIEGLFGLAAVVLVVRAGRAPAPAQRVGASSSR
jgi:hypothetical protein